jgi:hypothetical protein
VGVVQVTTRRHHGSRRVAAAVLAVLWWGTAQGKPGPILWVWRVWERCARRIWRTVPVPEAPHSLFEVYLGRYRGAKITLPDGTVVGHRDRVAELHLNNALMLRHAATNRYALVRLMAEDLQALANWMDLPEFPPDVKAVYGVTLLSQAARLLGFTVRDRPRTLYEHLNRLFMTGLLVLYAPDGVGRLSRGMTLGTFPRDVFLSRAELLRRFGASR